MQTTPVFDTYWSFAYERQNIFFKRINNSPPPFTEDSILKEYSFTNAYRASDRVSQYLIKNVLYDNDHSPDNTLFRLLIFKLFNSISTWELLLNSLDDINWETYSYNRYDKILTKAINAYETIYSAAYIMPSGKSKFGFDKKHRNNLKLVELIMKDNLISKIQYSNTFESVYKLLLSYPTIGKFLGYQYAIDINYSNIIDFSESEFTSPGPGALGGISKCFKNIKKGEEVELIQYMFDIQHDEFKKRDLKFKDLWGRPLQLIDIQNLFCEVDKYSRVKHPDIPGNSKRTRIKRKFTPTFMPIEYWYPPKWNINDKIN